jgi:hypothetical protein
MHYRCSARFERQRHTTIGITSGQGYPYFFKRALSAQFWKMM